jgi:hypothetical protein
MDTMTALQNAMKAPALVKTGETICNDMDPVLKHGVFHDISDEAGITYNGINMLPLLGDINNDGWKDIYVSMIFCQQYSLYNNRDGTFSNRLKEYFKHIPLIDGAGCKWILIMMVCQM